MATVTHKSSNRKRKGGNSMPSGSSLTTTSLEASITLKITETRNDNDDDDGNDDNPYGAYTSVKATVFRGGTGTGTGTTSAAKKIIGEISGIKVDRQKIPDGCFWETFDEHSGEMEWVAGSLLENKRGRTTLTSLRQAGDDPEFEFFLIQHFRIIDNDNDESNRRHLAVTTLTVISAMWQRLLCANFCIANRLRVI